MPNANPLIQTLATALRFNADYARRLVADLDEHQMTTIPAPGHENHAAFTIGHLITALDLAAQDLGQQTDMPAAYTDLFLRKGPADRRTPDPNANYPTRDQLTAELDRQTQRVITALDQTDPAWFIQHAEPWKLSQSLPTNADAMLFMCVTHSAIHLGQLAAWRRAMSLPPIMASMS